MSRLPCYDIRDTILRADRELVMKEVKARFVTNKYNYNNT